MEANSGSTSLICIDMTAERINDSEGEKDGWRQKETIGEDILNMEKKTKKKKNREKETKT